MKKIFSLVLALVMAVSLFTAVSAEGGSAKAVISVDKETVSVGDVITVTVSLENISSGELYAADAALYYNSDVLEYVAESGITVAESLTASGVDSIYQKVDDSVARCAVAFGVDTLDKMPAKVGESTALWSVQFKAISDGDASLQFAVEGKSPEFAASMPSGVMAFVTGNSVLANIEIGGIELLVGEGVPTKLISQIVGVSEVTVPVGSSAEDVIALLPPEVDVKLDNGETGKVKMSWTAGSLISGFDGNTAGEYYFTGNISDSGEYVNVNNLFSMVKVIVGDSTTAGADSSPDESTDAVPDSATEIVMIIGSSEPTINGVVAPIDVPAMILDDRTMTPARFVAEALGAEVSWDADARTVTITKDDYKIVLTIDSKIAEINGEQVEIDVPATIIDDRTLTPARLVAEALGAEVSWDDATKTVTIVK